MSVTFRNPRDMIEGLQHRCAELDDRRIELEAEVALLRQRLARESAAAMLWKQRAEEAGWDD